VELDIAYMVRRDMDEVDSSSGFHPQASHMDTVPATEECSCIAGAFAHAERVGKQDVEKELVVKMELVGVLQPVAVELVMV